MAPAPDRAHPEDLRALARSVAATVARPLREVAGAADLAAATGTKSTATDLVTEWDRRTEQAIVELLLARRPHDGMVGEEGADRRGTSGVRWVIDPIDGTTNFVYGFPGFNVSIAAEVDGTVVAGAVADVVHDEVFSASLGGGADRNGTSLHRRDHAELATALVATGFGYHPDVRRRQAEVLARVLPQVRDVRRMGAAAVDLCWVACNRLDGYWERGLSPWDHAAGALVAAEAGATVRFLDGADDGRGDVIVAAAPGLADDLATTVATAGAASA